MGGSNSAAEICEICEYENVKCLCDVKLTHKNEKYHWAGGNEIFEPEELKYFLGLKEVKLDYVIKGCCEHDNDQCTKLFHYQQSNGIKKQERFKWEEGKKRDSLVFEYDKHLLDILYTGNGSSTQSEMQVYVLSDDGKSISGTPATGATDLYTRSLGFLFASKFSGIPVTPYHIGVIECVNGKLASDKPKTGKANFQVIVLPEYKVVADFSINLAGAGKSHWSGNNFVTQKPTFGFQVEIAKLEEYIDGKKIHDIKINITELSKLPGINSLNPFNTFAALDKFLNKFKIPNLPIGPFSIELVPPKATFTGTAELKQNGDNTPLLIERTDTKAALEPIIGVAFKLDVIEALLTTCPPAAFYYKKMKEKTIKIGGLRSAKKGGDSSLSASELEALIEYESKYLRTKNNWYPWNWYSADMLIWADLEFSLSLNADFLFESSNVNEFPEFSGVYPAGIAKLFATMGIQIKVKLLVFTATIAAVGEMEASWKFRYVKAYEKEDGNARGSVKSGSGDNRELVIEYSGLRFRWKVEYSFGVDAKNDRLGSVGNSAEVGTSEYRDRQETMRDFGFRKNSLGGEYVEDESFYKQPSDVDLNKYLELDRALQAEGSYMTGQELYQMEVDRLARNRQLRDQFREFDQGEKLYSKAEVIHPEYRAGPVEV